MRSTIAAIFGYAGFVASFLAAVYWVYWIWQFDWSGSTRVRALFFLAMVFGAIIVFLARYFASLYASDAINPDTGIPVSTPVSALMRLAIKLHPARYGGKPTRLASPILHPM
jgi:hypothetical protein